MNYSLDFPWAYGQPKSTAILKKQPQDFIVNEIFDLDATNSGEHLYLHIKKTGENTQFVADSLAGFFGVKKMDVGVAGMKDRNAVTSQWFSCYLPGTDLSLDSAQFRSETGLNIELLSQTRHSQKLRRGAHQGNEFEICLRELDQDEDIENRLREIQEQGVPNYFGVQRFGIEASNLTQFQAMQEKNRQKRSGKKNKGGRNKESMLLSAARSWLFNLVLAERVKGKSWRITLSGDVSENESPNGPLWGRGRSLVQGDVAELEGSVLSEWQSWCDFLEHSGLKQERRPLILAPEDLTWTWEQNALRLKFTLEPGEYATSVLREICVCQQEKRAAL